MPQFFATCPRGIEDVLEKELHALDIKKTTKGVAGVSFHGNWAQCYEANLKLTSPSRILYPVLDFPAYSPDQIYDHVKKHDWTKYIDVKQTIAVDSSVRDSKITDLRIAALKVKDSVVDQFRDKYGERPDVDTEDPDLQISIRVVKNQCTVSLDTSGGSLHARGYRDRGAPAPLKENLAAALIKMTGWDEQSPLMDPMCGSGTFCIEAALMGLKIPPGTLRKRFGFQRWKTFQKDVFEKVVDKIGQTELSDVPFRIYGSDKDMRAVAAARANAENAGVETITIFKRQELDEFRPAPTPGVLITNPPYGERMGAGRGASSPEQSNEDLIELYKRLGQTLKNKFKGWRAFVLTSESSLMNALIEGIEMKPIETHRVFNGAIECRFLGFQIPE